MKYIKGESRTQKSMLPDSIDDYVDEENPVRVIDAFVDGLNMETLGFLRFEPAETGRPAYDPRDLLKLYIYGYLNKIRSSRKLKKECLRNVELFWLLGKLQPDFRTIADFRKENPKAIQNTFRAFGKICLKLKLYQKELLSIDGSKMRAQNSKDNCYNAETLEKKLAHIDEKISAYLSQMDNEDRDENAEEQSPEAVKSAIEELTNRKEKYQGHLAKLLKSGETQLLTTDPEARRMHSKDGFHCCYNVQTAVDSKSHLIAEYEVTNHNTDQGLLNEISEKSKKQLEVETVEVVADKGYESREDILNCIMNGTIPTVAMKYDKEERLYNIVYQEAAIGEAEYNSTKPEDICKCISAGVRPKCYERTCIEVELQEKSILSCFCLNDDGTVTCPMGNILRKVSTKGRNTEYACKDACRQCANRCTSSTSHKKVSFSRGTKYVPVRMYGSIRHELTSIPQGEGPNPGNHALFRKDHPGKKVVIHIKADKEKLKQRMCLSEHPFGTVKWYHGAHYLLCRGKEKAAAELGLSFLAYNLTRAINMIGVQALIAAM